MECHDNGFANNEVEQQIQEATRIGETNPSKEASSKGEGAKGGDAKGETNTAEDKASSKGEGAKGEGAKVKMPKVKVPRSDPHVCKIIGKQKSNRGWQQVHTIG